jgi:hypothetical protein
MIANSLVLSAAVENTAHLHHNKPFLVGIAVFVGLTVLLLITLQFNRDR